MFPSQALRVLAVALPLLLPVLAQQQPAAAFQHLLEKRSTCFVPNRRKGCVVWKSDSCCKACCTEYSRGSAPDYWGADCRCPARYPLPAPPPNVVIVQAPAPVPAPAPPPAPALAPSTTIVVNPRSPV